MALADELSALRATKPRTFDAWLEIAEPEDRELVLESIADRALMPNALSNVLRRHGVPCTRETIIKLRDEADNA